MWSSLMDFSWFNWGKNIGNFYIFSKIRSGFQSKNVFFAFKKWTGHGHGLYFNQLKGGDFLDWFDWIYKSSADIIPIDRYNVSKNKNEDNGSWIPKA